MEFFENSTAVCFFVKIPIGKIENYSFEFEPPGDDTSSIQNYFGILLEFFKNSTAVCFFVKIPTGKIENFSFEFESPW